MTTPDTGGPIRVLLIEDDEDDYLILTDTLDDIEGTSYDVTWIDNADDGLDALVHQLHDVCLIDYRLGAATGLDILNRAAANLVSVPCIVLTGTDNSETDRLAMEAGAVDYLVKAQLQPEAVERSIRYAIANAAANRRTRESEGRFRSVFEGAHDGIAVFDENGVVERANPAACTMFGLTTESMHGIHFSKLLADGEIEPVSARFREWANDSQVTISSLETLGRRESGSAFPLELSVASFMHERKRCWSAIMRDTSRTTELLDQLAHQTLHDRLTGLANRALLRERLDAAVQLIRFSESTPSLLIVALDNFKAINDLHGHDLGDRLLTSVAERLNDSIRSGETLARLGSDEFAVLAEGRLDAHAAIRLAERLRVLFHEPFKIDHLSLQLTASVGIAIVDDPDADADAVIRNADVAMYTAKANGKDRVEVFEERMYGDLLDVLALEQDLRTALEAGEISAHFQPILDLESRRVHSFEALARWHHPDRGWVRPDLFIAAAERSGCIDQLGLIVLGQALDLVASMADESVAVAVNVSSHQLQDRSFVDSVITMLSHRQLPGTRLVLEVTESMMIGDVDEVIALLAELRTHGIRIALDDFGTGYSSLAYLRRLPVDELKLDQSFVRGSDSPQTQALIEAVANIAQSFNLTSIAEGIEDERELGVVSSLGFTCGQGYLFARPMPAAEAISFATSRSQQDA